jgi:hypothetical protein
LIQRSSAVAATLFLGTTQCGAPSDSVAPAVTAPAAAAPTTTGAGSTDDATGARLNDPVISTTVASSSTTTTAPAIVAGPDGTTVQGRCTQWEDLLTTYAPARGWDVERMSRLAWRESNCWAEIRSRTSDSGLLQINDITLSFLNDALGETVDPFTLMDPVQNIRAAAALCDFWARNGSSCYQPWSTS